MSERQFVQDFSLTARCQAFRTDKGYRGSFGLFIFVTDDILERLRRVERIRFLEDLVTNMGLIIDEY